MGTNNGPKEIWSGGQTGADQGGLEAAKILGLKTSGWMPKDFLTETGPRPDIAGMFGLREHVSKHYSPRTAANIKSTNATLIIGDATSPGSNLTKNIAERYGRPVLLVPFSEEGQNPIPAAKKVADFFNKHRPHRLNVAGNRETKNPGIHRFTKEVLIMAMNILYDEKDEPQ